MRLILDYFPRSECGTPPLSFSFFLALSLFRSLWQKMGIRADRCTVFCWISLRASVVVQWADTARKKLAEACTAPAGTLLFPSAAIWLKIPTRTKTLENLRKKKGNIVLVLISAIFVTRMILSLVSAYLSNICSASIYFDLFAKYILLHSTLIAFQHSDNPDCFIIHGITYRKCVIEMFYEEILDDM